METTKLEQSIQNYKRLGIEVKILDDHNVLIKQRRIFNGIILNQDELHKRGREIFPDKTINIIPSVFSINVEEITEDWIRERMDAFGIKRGDLVKQMALDRSYLSLLFADQSNIRKIGLSKPMKAAFFYYFLSYELSNEIREILNQ